MSGHKKWSEIKHKNTRKGLEGNPIGQAKAGLLKTYNRPWWKLVRWWDNTWMANSWNEFRYRKKKW